MGTDRLFGRRAATAGNWLPINGGRMGIELSRSAGKEFLPLPLLECFLAGSIWRLDAWLPSIKE